MVLLRAAERASADALASLRRRGHPYRLSPTELYIGLMRSSGAMTHRLAQLEAARLIKRVPDRSDGRSLLVELTAKGLRLVDRVAAKHLENERRMLAALAPAEQHQLIWLLCKLLVGLEGSQAVPPAGGSGGRRRRPPPGEGAGLRRVMHP